MYGLDIIGTIGISQLWKHYLKMCWEECKIVIVYIGIQSTCSGFVIVCLFLPVSGLKKEILYCIKKTLQWEYDLNIDITYDMQLH